jgi:hypothetical protein
MLKGLVGVACSIALLSAAGPPVSSSAFARTTSAAQELGTITFPNSGAAAAQAAFIEGVKDLHSFQFDEAAVAFQRAQQADPDFAMAYWGEAMSFNHPLWAQQDAAAAKKILDRLAPTPDARQAKAKLPKEKAFLKAIDVLYGAPGDKLARDIAYSDTLAAMYEQWPTDHEVATWYALSLLGSVRPTDKGFRRQALAASIAETVFRENPRHPGAAHFIFHAFDDPDHAPLGRAAARAYAAIAPSAAHALHMPSHIFLQRGMWQDVRTSNIAAYKSATELNARMKLAEGREDFHTLGWLQYANLMLGNIDEAKANVESAKQAADRNPANAGIRNGYLGMRARLILETGNWEPIALEAPDAPHAPDAHSAMPGMAMPAGNTWIFIAGYSAARRGDLAAAERAVAMLRGAREKLEAGSNPYAAKPVAIMENQVAALVASGRGQKDAASKLAKDAMEIELSLSAPSGPPDPIKPATEFYGEMLLDAGRNAEAMAVLELSLQRTPNRTPSLTARSRARGAGTAMR